MEVGYAVTAHGCVIDGVAEVATLALEVSLFPSIFGDSKSDKELQRH